MQGTSRRPWCGGDPGSAPALLYDAGNDHLVLLCFEDVDQPGKSCHRRMLATWWQEHTGDVVPELEPSCALSSSAAGSQDVRVGFGANTECWYRKLRRNLKSAHGSGARRCPLRDPCECLAHFEKQPLPGNFGEHETSRTLLRRGRVHDAPQTAHRCAWRQAMVFRVESYQGTIPSHKTPYGAIRRAATFTRHLQSWVYKSSPPLLVSQCPLTRF
jgi:hypothetical protein